jgi:2'-5' RNA ligase
MIRCFVALNFPVPLVRRIAEEVERRKGRIASPVAWVPPANYHVTLRFLGGVREELVEALSSRLSRAVGGLAPFELQARGFGAFPAADRARVLWVGAEGGALSALQQKVELVVVGLGLAPEERPFHPHLTVGRVKQPGDAQAWVGPADVGAAPVQEIVVYESRTLAKGAEYVALSRVALSKGAKEEKNAS